jgi:hypothetical protein
MRKAQAPPRPLVDRLARVVFTFLVMNCAAVVGLLSAVTQRKVWK